MAANDFYQQSYADNHSSSQPPKVAENGRPLSHIALSYNPNPSASTLDHSRHSQAYSSRPLSNYYEPYDHSRQSVLSDSIPLKPKSNINTTGADMDDWRNQSTQYPPSPESNSRRLLPDSKGRKKVEGSYGNFFKGKIPWVVYTLSLIQISVFIAEIIKNCEYTLWSNVVTMPEGVQFG